MVHVPLDARGGAGYTYAAAAVTRVHRGGTHKLEWSTNALPNQLYTKDQFTHSVQKLLSIEDVYLRAGGALMSCSDSLHGPGAGR